MAAAEVRQAKGRMQHLQGVRAALEGGVPVRGRWGRPHRGHGEAAAPRAFDPANHEREFEASADELGLEPGTRRFLWKLSCLG